MNPMGNPILDLVNQNTNPQFARKILWMLVSSSTNTFLRIASVLGNCQLLLGMFYAYPMENQFFLFIQNFTRDHTTPLRFNPFLLKVRQGQNSKSDKSDVSLEKTNLGNWTIATWDVLPVSSGASVFHSYQNIERSSAPK
ncbi:hypothetical protein CMV_009065 [Castanea mollissima]|uniref:Uncharacterized protein n=1 Tax=Castanea mollissima TaxID=60419 RepID=A0A8J4VR92_9ROSI|nr:hypothetical protein CMV_009065 [Castanea mollissima]